MKKLKTTTDAQIAEDYFCESIATNIHCNLLTDENERKKYVAMKKTIRQIIRGKRPVSEWPKED